MSGTQSDTPIPPELAKHLRPMCTVRGCNQLAGHAGEHGTIPINMKPLRP